MEEDDNGSELSISVVDDAIIVTMPGTSHQQMDISRPSLDRSQ